VKVSPTKRQAAMAAKQLHYFGRGSPGSKTGCGTTRPCSCSTSRGSTQTKWCFPAVSASGATLLRIEGSVWKSWRRRTLSSSWSSPWTNARPRDATWRAPPEASPGGASPRRARGRRPRREQLRREEVRTVRGGSRPRQRALRGKDRSLPRLLGNRQSPLLPVPEAEGTPRAVAARRHGGRRDHREGGSSWLTANGRRAPNCGAYAAQHPVR
jgi:hypothetical protein